MQRSFVAFVVVPVTAAVVACSSSFAPDPPDNRPATHVQQTTKDQNGFAIVMVDGIKCVQWIFIDDEFTGTYKRTALSCDFK